jgi:hypothetical protein
MQKFATRVAMCLGVFVFVLCAAVSSAQAPDPIVGTWKLNLATVVARTRAGTVEYMKAGKVVSTTTSVMSDDGETLTVTVKFLNAQGNEVTTVAVYDRQ